MKGFKSFDKDFKCRDFQFKVGETYEHKGSVSLCNAGFHFCEHPLDVFGYYPPTQSRYATVEADGVSDKTDGDTKRVAKSIVIKAELTMHAVIAAAVKFVFDRADWSKKANHVTDRQGAASATGYQGAAVALGLEAKAKGSIGCWITVAEWKYDDSKGWQRVNVKTARVDGKRIKADTFYQLKGGKFVECR